MKVLYLSNFFNHHQKFLSDVLYGLLGEGNYYFVETRIMPEEQKNLGYHSYDVPYLLQYNEQSREEIDKMILDADVVQFGEAPLSMITARKKSGRLILRNSERRYKSLGRYLKWPIYTYESLIYNKGYLLAASAFAPRDYLLSGMRPDRCFRWGYFPEVKRYDDIEDIFEKKRKNREAHGLDVSILWAARLIGWKHPEAVIDIARTLNAECVKYKITVIGAGPLEGKMQKLIERYDLAGRVCLIGPMPPETVREYMEDADVFLMTSDQNEGWGVTLNEAMNSACAIVAGSMIGSVPYLLRNGVNGLIFDNKDWDEMEKLALILATDSAKRRELGINAYRTIVETWNPKVAGKNLVALYNSLLNGEENPINEGPCSQAEIICSNWMKKIMKCQQFFK